MSISLLLSGDVRSKTSLDSTQITESQGRQLQPLPVKVTGSYSNPNSPKWQWQAHLPDTHSVGLSPDRQQIASSGDESVYVLDSTIAILITSTQVHLTDQFVIECCAWIRGAKRELLM